MIPKIIHYCWFGRGKIPVLANKCINSWKKYLPDYKLMLWNEDNFDVNIFPYTKEAYKAGKFAFVTDYVRLCVLYEFGGIYMDIDVEILKSLDDLLTLTAFSGFETKKDIPTGIMASEPKGTWIKELLYYYPGRHFIQSNGMYDLTTNTQIITCIMAKGGFIPNNQYQVYNNCMHLFPTDYFCPKGRTGIINITENTYCIHHLAGTWNPWYRKVKTFFFRKVLGTKIEDKLVRLKRNLLKKELIK
jgi:hypothetical protein